MKCRGFNTLRNGPFHSSIKDTFIVSIHSENETAVDHYAIGVKTSDSCSIVPSQVVGFVLSLQIAGVQRFKTYK